MVGNSRQGLPAISITSQPGSTDENLGTHQGPGLCLRIFTANATVGFNGGMNLYRYADNNPMLFVDPMGLFKISSQLANCYYEKIDSDLAELKGQVENLFKGELKEEFLKYITGNSLALESLEKEETEPIPGYLGHYSHEAKTVYLSKVVGSFDKRVDRLSVIIHEMAHAFINRKGQTNGLILDTILS